MLLPKLIGAVWVLVLIHGALILLSNEFEVKRYPTLALTFRMAPWVFPVLCVGAFIIAWQLDRRHGERLLDTGRLSSAVVLEVRDRGIELGVDPVLTVRVRVTPNGAEPFEGEVAFAPSRLDMGLVRKGTTLAVRYDPNDRSRIAVEAITNAAAP